MGGLNPIVRYYRERVGEYTLTFATQTSVFMGQNTTKPSCSVDIRN